MARQDAEAEARADDIQEASQPENIWYGEGLLNEEGKSFEGYGSLVLASSRLDPAYMKACAARARKRTREYLARVKKDPAYRLRYLTFTIPPVFGFDAERAFALFTTALVLLKKRKWFKYHVRGAVIGGEVTPGQRITHFHFHAHILGYTRAIKAQEMREQWTECLKVAAAKLGVAELPINTRDGLAVANIKRVVPKVESGRDVTLEMAIQETCKYTVKGVDFLAFPAEHLCQLERVLRGRRLITTFGECNESKGRSREAGYVHKQGINDGSKTDVVTEKPRTLLEKGAELIRAGRREEWRRELTAEYARRRAWRIDQLRYKYPRAVFRTLAGEVFYGDDFEGCWSGKELTGSMETANPKLTLIRP
jgi:hypothetical protein